LTLGALGVALLLSGKTASAQYKTNVYLEAECPSSSSGAYGTKLTTTGGYSGPGYIKSTGNTTAATYNNTSADHAFYTFTTNLSGFLVAYFRVNTNGNTANDSFFFRADGSAWETVNNLSGLGTGWHWVQASTTFGFGTGAHTLEIANRETGLQIDKVAFLNATDPVPSGIGGTAYNCPVPMYFEAECPKTAFGAYPFPQIKKTGYSGAGYLYSLGNNTGSATSSTDIATYPFDSGTATYTFYFRVDTNNSANDDSWFYSVDSGAWTTMNNITSATGWRWVQGTATASLTVGRHTLEVRNREDGLNIDKIAFIPSGQTAPSGVGGTSVNCDPATTIETWGYWEQVEYGNTHLNFFSQNAGAYGAMVIDMHVGWHNFNHDPGGEQGPGSGVAFLGMHRSMMNDFRKYALGTGQRSWIPLSMSATLPDSVPDAYNPLLAAGQSYVDTWYAPRQGSDLSTIGMPPYLTASGGPAVGAWQSTYCFKNDAYQCISPSYAKLSDIPDLDTLGRIIGTSNFHTSVHAYISGTMADYGSPSDPFFYAWHGLIDKIADDWLKTTTGRNWMNANPNHPFLQIGFTEMTGWDDQDWAP
jgi:hypothetical protein